MGPVQGTHPSHFRGALRTLFDHHCSQEERDRLVYLGPNPPAEAKMMNEGLKDRRRS